MTRCGVEAKLYTGELSNRVANAALQIHGGYGYMEESAIARLCHNQTGPRSAKAPTRFSVWSSRGTSASDAGGGRLASPSRTGGQCLFF